MAQHLKLPALGALAVAAAAFGLHLGESAVADINPIHFQGPAIHPRDRGAAVADLPQAPVQSQFALAYGWDQGANARQEDCPGCGPAGSADHYPRSAAGYRSEVDIALAPPPARWVRESEERVEEEPDAFAAQYASVDRYAHYAIEEGSPEEAPADEADYGASEE